MVHPLYLIHRPVLSYVPLFSRATSVEFYNEERPHMSLNNLTPREAAKMKDKIQKKWISYREKYIESLEVHKGATTFTQQTLNSIELIQ